MKTYILCRNGNECVNTIVCHMWMDEWMGGWMVRWMDRWKVTHVVRCKDEWVKKFCTTFGINIVQWVPQLFERLEFFHVNMSSKTQCCGNKTCQIIQDMTLGWGSELKLSLLCKTAISSHHPLFHWWGKVDELLLPLYFKGSRGSHTFTHLYNKGCWHEIVVYHNRLSLLSL